jgi:hypothetical protein
MRHTSFHVDILFFRQYAKFSPRKYFAPFALLPLRPLRLDFLPPRLQVSAKFAKKHITPLAFISLRPSRLTLLCALFG